jgi:hypothetical protein
MTHPADGTAQPLIYAVGPAARVLYTADQARADSLRHFRCALAAARKALRNARVAQGLNCHDLVAYFVRDAKGYHVAAIGSLRKAREIAA